MTFSLALALAQGAQARGVTIEGSLFDPPARLIDTLGLRGKTTLTKGDFSRITKILDTLGYRVRRRRRGGQIVLKLRPYLVVRRIYVRGNWPLFEDEILRRLRFRPGQRFPEGEARARAIATQEERMRRFLAREGYFEGSLRIVPKPADDRGRIDLEIRLFKGRSYKIGDVKIDRRSSRRGIDGAQARSAPQAGEPSDDEIRRHFSHHILFYRRPFDTERFKADVEDLKKEYQKRGFPGARIRETFIVDPCRPSHRAVRIKLRIQPRKRISVTYAGNDNVKGSELDEALTMKTSGSYDDHELAQSAESLRRLYQRRGYLQARVRFSRKPLDLRHDRVTFFISEGPIFRVERVQFAGNKHIGDKDLRKTVRTRTFPWLGYLGLGEGGFVTSRQLRQDAMRIEAYYRDRGFASTKVVGSVAPHPALIGRPGALAAGVATGAATRAGRAYVRFTIVEGPRVAVTKVRISAGAPAHEHAPGPTSRPSPPDPGRVLDVSDRPGNAPAHAGERHQRTLSFSHAELSAALAATGLNDGAPFTAAKLKKAKEVLFYFYAERGYIYAEVDSMETLAPSGKAIDVQLTVTENKPARVGPIFVRGNFKTRESVILDALGFKTGDRFNLRKIRKAEDVLRKLNIFNSVRIQWLGVQQRPEYVPLLIRVEERYDDHGSIEFGVGGSSDNRFFASMAYNNNNLLGFGTQFEAKGEVGIEIQAGSLRFTNPRLFTTAFTLDTTAFIRKQSTERLGDILTFGGTAKVEREITRALRMSLRYEIRRVKHQEDLNRPASGRDEWRQVDVFTTTAGAGPTVVYDTRDNRLSPTRGLRLAASALWASTLLGGTDDFITIRGSAQYYISLPLSITIAIGARYDQGFPLGDRVLLPKVDRFYAGGDTTIRGFEEDRAFAERVVYPVAPYRGVTITRVVPQGGNIRLLTNLELQFPIWRESPLFGRDLLFATFFDNGAVSNSFAAMDLRQSIGWALRVVLPVGFASFEYAVPLDPKIGDDKTGRFHFNFGFIL